VNHGIPPIVGFVSRLLGPDEREAVLGDLTEAGESGWRALSDVLGLVARREAAQWTSWQPWLAALGLALPASFLLMGLSVSVSAALLHAASLTSTDLAPFFCRLALLSGGAWAGGVALASLSRRTLWTSAFFTVLPCSLCLVTFRTEGLSGFSLFLFLPVLILGVRHGLRAARIEFRRWAAFSAALTLVTLTPALRGMWAPEWLLLWPGWYLAATAARAEKTL